MIQTENADDTHEDYAINTNHTVKIAERGDEVRVTIPADIVNAYDFEKGDAVSFNVSQQDGKVNTTFHFNPGDTASNVRQLNYNPSSGQWDIRFPKHLSRALNLGDHVSTKLVHATFSVVGEEKVQADEGTRLFPVLSITMDPPVLLSAAEGLTFREDIHEVVGREIGKKTLSPEAVGYGEKTDREEYVQIYRTTLPKPFVDGYSLTETIQSYIQVVVDDGDLALAVMFGEPPADGEHVTRKVYKNSNRQQQFALSLPAAIIEAMDLSKVDKRGFNGGILLSPSDETGD
jgi:hypothetical protein